MFASDKPVETSCDDLLGRSSFAEQLANAIASYSNADSCTIGLYGKWGAGKTSVINMITETLEERNKRGDKGNQIIIVHFNPWNYSDRAQIIDQFFKTISTELKITNAPKALKTVGDALEKYSGALEYTTLIPKIGKYLSFLPALLRGTGLQLSSRSKDLGSLSHMKEAVIQALNKINQRILIIIDDIDRLNSEQIRLIFQLVNSVAGFPKLIYLLAFDKSVVIKALAQEQSGNGEAYLEKIIQVPFEVPEARQNQILKFFANKIADILSADDKSNLDEIYWGAIFNKCISPFIHSIRDANRISNVFEFKYGLMAGEVNWIDLLAITVLQVTSESLFTWIKDHQHDLVGISRDYGELSGGESLANYNKYLTEFNVVFPQNPQLAIKTVQTLFPKFGWATGPIHSSETHDSLRTARRIASDRHSHLFFLLSLDDDAIPKSVIDESFTEYSAEMLRTFLETASQRKQLDYYFQELGCRINEIPADRIELFYNELVSWCNPSANIDFFFGVTNVTAYPICLKLLKQLGPESAYEKLKAGAMGDNLSITATCIKAFWNIKRAYGQVGSHPNYEHRLIEEDKITDLESTVRAAFKELYKTDDLFRSGYFGELSRIWRQLDEAECKEYELNCISKLENIPYFLEDCKGSWTSGGAHGPIFFNENFEGYISTESLYERVCLLKGSDIYNQLTDTLKNTVVAFYLWYASVGQGGDGKITEEKISEERKSWDA